MAKELGLTKDQQEKMKAHRKANFAEVKKLHEAMKEKREAMAAALEKPTVNLEEVKKLHAEMKDLQGQMADLRFNGILDLRQILTVDQFKKMHEKMKEHDHKMGSKGSHEKGRHHDDMGGGPGGPDGPGDH